MWFSLWMSATWSAWVWGHGACGSRRHMPHIFIITWERNLMQCKLHQASPSHCRQMLKRHSQQQTVRLWSEAPRTQQSHLERMFHSRSSFGSKAAQPSSSLTCLYTWLCIFPTRSKAPRGQEHWLSALFLAQQEAPHIVDWGSVTYK